MLDRYYLPNLISFLCIHLILLKIIFYRSLFINLNFVLLIKDVTFHFILFLYFLQNISFNSLFLFFIFLFVLLNIFLTILFRYLKFILFPKVNLKQVSFTVHIKYVILNLFHNFVIIFRNLLEYHNQMKKILFLKK